MKIGYARISKYEQNIDMQMDALRNAGCEKIFQDTASGVREDRPGLKEMFEYMREGDTLVVWKLDRLGRSMKHLLDILQKIEKSKARFHSLQENIDTTTSIGLLFFHLISALAQFERGLIVERSKEGLKAARDRGKYGGRRYMLNTAQVRRLKEVHENRKDLSIKEICDMFKISKQSMYNYLDLEQKGLPGEIQNCTNAMLKQT